MDPFDPPLQETWEIDAIEAVSRAGSVIMEVALDVHPLASVTTTV